MSRFQELIVYCLVALVISGTNGLGIGPRYLMDGVTTAPANIGFHNLSPYCNHHGTWNGYSCVCLDNWSGDRCQFAPANIGLHNLSPYCNHHGYWNGYCVCLDNWSGDRCQFAPVVTTQDPCHNHCVHGHCEPVYNNYGYIESHHCHCDNNWHGIDCDQQYTSTDPCFDTCVHGRCVHGISSYYCHCDDSWQGKNCDSGTILQCDDTYCVHGMCVYYVGPQGRHENSHCECYHGWHGQTCEDLFIHTTVAPTQMLETFSTSTSTPSTTQTPTTSSSSVLMTSAVTEPSTVTTTTQTLPPVTATIPHHSSSTMVTVTSTMTSQVACNKLSTLIDITQQTQADNQNASLCPSGSHTSHEAFVLKNCPASQNPANWQPGVEVMTMCSAGAASVPDYTAIAAFENGRYSAAGGLSGILVGCLADGFKMAVQRCDQPPHIVDIHVGGANLDNPNAYFAIV